jgi:hypothetical protein
MMMKEETRKGVRRQDFQTAMITTALNTGDKERARRIQRIQNAEVLKAVWPKCAAARGQHKTGGISTVMVPTDPEVDLKTCNEWIQLDDIRQVNEAITKRLQQHFSQAKQCTWTKPPLDVTMDFTGCCEKAERILTGTYSTDQLNISTSRWIVQNMYVAGHHEAIKGTINEE